MSATHLLAACMPAQPRPCCQNCQHFQPTLDHCGVCRVQSIRIARTYRKQAVYIVHPNQICNKHEPALNPA